MMVGPHIHQTSVGDQVLVHTLARKPGALPTGLVEAQGSSRAVHFERGAVVIGAGTGEFQGSGREAAGSTEVPEVVAAASYSPFVVGFHQCSQVA